MSVLDDTAGLADMLFRKRLFIFDFDGVVADSVEVKTEAFAKIYKPYGADIVARVVEHHRNNGGMSRYDKFRCYQCDLLGKDIDEDRVNALAEQFSDLVKQAVISAAEIPGARSMLASLADQGKTCAVNSATPQEEMIEIVERRELSQYFEGVYGSPASKLENLHSIIDDFAISPDAAVFFGDAVSDFDAARAAGIDFIGVGESLRRHLEVSSGTNFAISDFRDLGYAASN